MQRLLAEPHLFSFFQVVQLVERLKGPAARVGQQGPASEECFRFRPALSFAFPPGDVSGIEVVTDDYGRERYQVETTFLGLYGTVSPLPTFYTEELLHERGEESIVRGFIDIFHHRLLSLFYRCWEKYRYHILFYSRGADEFSRKMFCLSGMGTVAPPDGSAVAPVLLLRYAGLLIQKPCSQAALRSVIADYFAPLPTVVTPCVPRWVLVTEPQRNRLGGGNSILGRTFHVGGRVRDRSSKFRITIGSLGLDRFLSFLPHMPNFRAMDEIVRLFVADQLQYEVELILRREEIPDLQLVENSPGALLGQTTWLGRPSEDARVVLQEPRRDGWSNPGVTEDRRAAALAA